MDKKMKAVVIDLYWYVANIVSASGRYQEFVCNHLECAVGYEEEAKKAALALFVSVYKPIGRHDRSAWLSPDHFKDETYEDARNHRVMVLLTLIAALESGEEFE